MGGNVFNEKDSMDINELASLNGDISPELIEQLQQKLSNEAKNFTSEEEQKPAFNASDDTTLFEEPANSQENATETSDATKEENPAEVKAPKKPIQLDKNFDDNFIKKYKAKLEKQKHNIESTENKTTANTISSSVFPAEDTTKPEESIDKVSNGKITEKVLTNEQKSYNDSLDYLDGNVKYSKYVIYIDPQNVDFIESLTVKERKNLINKVLREQDNIAITKQRFYILQTVIKHAIIAILTISISVPIVYYTINASLEATINNYRRSQNIFQTLYKENGKISTKR